MSPLMNTILIIGVSAIVFGMLIAILVLIKKGTIDKKDIPVISDDGEAIVKFAYVIAISSGMNKELADKIKNVALDTFEYLKSLNPDVSEEDRITSAIEYINALCVSFNIPLDDDKKIIIEDLAKYIISFIDKKVAIGA